MTCPARDQEIEDQRLSWSSLRRLNQARSIEWYSWHLPVPNARAGLARGLSHFRVSETLLTLLFSNPGRVTWEGAMEDQNEVSRRYFLLTSAASVMAGIAIDTTTADAPEDGSPGTERKTR